MKYTSCKSAISRHLVEDALTLTTVVVNIRIRRVVLDCRFEGSEGGFGVTHFHMHAGNLDPGLRIFRIEFKRRDKVFLGSNRVACQESN